MLLHQHLLCLADPTTPALVPADPAALPVSGVLWHTPPRQYPAALYAFLHLLRAGLPWAHALEALAHLPLGHFSADGRVFCVPGIASGGGLPDACPSLPLRAPSDPNALTFFFCGPAVVAICSSHSVSARPTPRALGRGAPPSVWGTEPLPARLHPSQKASELGRHVCLYGLGERHKRLGPLDEVLPQWQRAACPCPGPGPPLHHSRRTNHVSWKRNEAAKIALGPKFTTWTWPGVVEMVPQGPLHRAARGRG
jgi:hypothetical protein